MSRRDQPVAISDVGIRIFFSQLAILDGNDFYSHHRRVAICILREFTKGIFQSNFNRYGLDFSILGDDGNLREMSDDEKEKNYDFHFTDVKKFYTHETSVYAPADGEIVEVVNDLEDLYETTFDVNTALANNKIKELAGNYIVIKHSDYEYSHLYHLLKESCMVKQGDFVRRDQDIAKVGFSGASNIYSHLHYQFMDGSDMLNARELPVKFSNIIIWKGSEKKIYKEVVINTGDILQRNK